MIKILTSRSMKTIDVVSSAMNPTIQRMTTTKISPHIIKSDAHAKLILKVKVVAQSLQSYKQ